MGTDIKIKLATLGKKQVDLLEVLWKRGFPRVTPPFLSACINGRTQIQQAFKVREEIYKILDEWEEEQSRKIIKRIE